VNHRQLEKRLEGVEVPVAMKERVLSTQADALPMIAAEPHPY